MIRLMFVALIAVMLCGGQARAQTATGRVSCGANSTTAGATTPANMDASGNLCVNVAAGAPPLAIAPIYSSAPEAAHVLKSTAGTLFGFQVNTVNADWVMLLNLASIPASGSTVDPVAIWQLPAGSTYPVNESPGLLLSTGIVVVCSSTGPTTYTPDATCWFGSGIVQ